VIQLLVARQCVEVDLLTGSQTARDQVPGLHARRSDLSEQLKIGRLAGRAPRVLRVDASHENGRSLPGFFDAGHDTSVPTRASAKQRRCAYLAPPGNEAGAVFRRSAATGPARRAASDLAAGAAQAEGLGAPAQAGAAFLCGTWSAVALLGCAENHGARLEPVFEAPGVLSEQHATQLGEPVGAVLEHAKDRYALVFSAGSERDERRRLWANPVPAGSDVSAATYRCTNCSDEIQVGRPDTFLPARSVATAGTRP
jgi:hypothetical protein